MLQLNHLRLQEFQIQESKGLFTFYRQTDNYQKLMLQRANRLKNVQKSNQKSQTLSQQKIIRNRTLTEPKKQSKKQKKYDMQTNYVKLTSPRCAVLNISPKINHYVQTQLPIFNLGSQIMASSINPLKNKIPFNQYAQNRSIILNKSKLKSIQDQITIQKQKQQQNQKHKTDDISYKTRKEIFLNRRSNNKNAKNKQVVEVNSQESSNLSSLYSSKDINSIKYKKMLVLYDKQKKLTNYRLNQLKLNSPSINQNSIKSSSPSINLNSKKSIKDIINQYRKKYQSSLNSNLFSKLKNQDQKSIEQIEKSHILKKQFKKIYNQQVFVYKEAIKSQQNISLSKEQKKHFSSIQILKQPQRVQHILERYKNKSAKWKNIGFEKQNDNILLNYQ